MRLANKTIYMLARLLRQTGFDFHEDIDPRVLEMKKEVQRIGGRIEFKIEQYPNGSWVAESTNLDGVITGGRHTREIQSMIRDAIFTYFSIPPHLCKDTLLHADNEPVTVRQHVYV